jgi:CheY-like chemotaxis protein
MFPNMRNRHAPLTVLLVDDEALFRAIAKTMMAVLGCEVLEAVDGLQAVEMVQRDQPGLDLVICDFRMPGLDGVETLRALRLLRPGLKAILCSGTPEEDCLQGRTLEDCVYLGKPFKIQDLDRTLNRLLDPVDPSSAM